MFAAVIDDLEMQPVPRRFWKQTLQIAFGLQDRFPSGQIPALGQTVDVCVHWEGWDAEGLRHHDLGGLVADTGQSFQRFE